MRLSLARTCLGAALLLAVAAPAAFAANELYIRWDNCYGDGGVYNKAFACDVNTGVDYLVASYRLDQALDSVTGLEAGVSVASVSTTLPSWWEYKNAGSCRATSLSLVVSPPATASNCLDPWGGNAAGGIGQYQTNSSPIPPGTNSALIRLVVAVPPQDTFSVPANREVFAFRLGISHTRTVGSPSCAGCDVPVCLGFSYGKLTRPVGAGDVFLSGVNTPANGSRATWQPGGAASSIGGGCAIGHVCTGWVTCEAATPVPDRTWGSIKSLYR